MARERVTVQEAARRLGVKDDAIRKRIQRGTLEHDKRPDGRVYVYLDQPSVASEYGRARNAAEDASYDAFLVSLRDQVSYLRSVLKEEKDARRRADTIIAQLTRANAALAARAPELEAPVLEPAPSRRPPEVPRSVAEDGEKGEAEWREPLEKREGRRGFWARLFGG
jgi:excisionase family DNA binding protein